MNPIFQDLVLQFKTILPTPANMTWICVMIFVFFYLTSQSLKLVLHLEDETRLNPFSWNWSEIIFDFFTFKLDPTDRNKANFLRKPF